MIRQYPHEILAQLTTKIQKYKALGEDIDSRNVVHYCIYQQDPAPP